MIICGLFTKWNRRFGRCVAKPRVKTTEAHKTISSKTSASRSTPGETKQNPGQTPGRNDGGLRVDPQQDPENPAMAPAANRSR